MWGEYQAHTIKVTDNTLLHNRYTSGLSSPLEQGVEVLIPRLIARHVARHITVYIAVNRDTQQRVGVDGSYNRLFANPSTTVQ